MEESVRVEQAQPAHEGEAPPRREDSGCDESQADDESQEEFHRNRDRVRRVHDGRGLRRCVPMRRRHGLRGLQNVQSRDGHGEYQCDED